MILIFTIYIIFGVLPSLLWLFYYFKKDLHPESKKMILKVFLWGAVATIPAIIVQDLLTEITYRIVFSEMIRNIIYWFLIISFTEEFFKYIVVKIKVLNNSELDEPVDMMVYMVVSALGFAAVENIFYIISFSYNLSFNDAVFSTIMTSLARFVGATFLHTLSSALVGYFLAKSALYSQKYFNLSVLGIVLATILHGIYNFFIINVDGPAKIFGLILILAATTVFVMSGFERIKKIKSVCEINPKLQNKPPS